MIKLVSAARVIVGRHTVVNAAAAAAAAAAAVSTCLSDRVLRLELRQTTRRSQLLLLLLLSHVRSLIVVAGKIKQHSSADF